MLSIGWRAYCSDGTTVDSSASTWDELQRFGLVGVVEFREPPYRKLWYGYDWIWREDGRFRVVNSHPERGEWRPAPDVPKSCLKAGEYLPDEVWSDLRRSMLGDRQWP